MANILPFAALRYNTTKLRLEDVLTQPYDKITPSMQSGYYAASPYNLIRVELGKLEPDDNQKKNVYTRAAGYLQDWRRQGILTRDPEPSIYAYLQRFALPGVPGRKLERRGFIALCQLKDYSEGVVFRHELTLSKPKADRMDLLRATRTHTGHIFMLYSDSNGSVEKPVWRFADRNPPTSTMTDEYGVEHSLWRISDPAIVLTMRDQMQEKKLIIADGHHRYETALMYRNQRRTDHMASLECNVPRTGQIAYDYSAPYENLMMTFVNMDSDGLLILPTHRVVFGLPNFHEEKLLQGAAEFFEIVTLSASTSPETLVAQLKDVGKQTSVITVITSASTYLFRHRKQAVEDYLKDYLPQQRGLDVLQLHKILLEKVLGISEEDIRNQVHLNYLRGADEAVARVREGANAAFLMNPVRMDQLRDVAFAGEVMPQKSTDFYPKLLSGLTIYPLE